MRKIPLIKIYCVRLFLSIIFAVLFVLFFNYSLANISLHSAIILLLLLIEFIAIKFLYKFAFLRRAKLFKQIALIVSSISFACLGFLYVLDIATNKLWYQNLNLNYVLYALRNAGSLRADAGISIAGLFYVFLFIFFSFYLLQLFLVDFTSVKLDNFFGNKKGKIIFLSAFVVIFILPVAFNPVVYSKSKYSREEPVISFLSPIFNAQRNNAKGVLHSDKLMYLDSINADNIKNKNVIVIFMDSARAENFPMYGYSRNTSPFLNDLYSQGKLLKVNYAFSGCSESVCGALSFFTSRDYDTLNLQNTRDSEILIQEILKKAGYKNYFLTGTDAMQSKWVEPLYKSWSEDFDMFIDANNNFDYSKTENVSSPAEPSVPSAVTSSSKSDKPGFIIQDDKKIFAGVNSVPDKGKDPAFFTFWLSSTHLKGTKEKMFDVFNPTEDEIDTVTYAMGGIDKNIIVNRYDNGIIQTDYYISEIFKLLSQKGYLDNSIVFILGDHGESLGEKGVYGHLAHLYNEQMRIPLLIYSSDKIDIKNLDYATQEDISATILDVLGIKAPQWWQGVSLLSENGRTDSIHELANNLGGEKVLITKNGDKLYKYFYINDNSYVFDSSSEQKLYELYSDPYENNNIIDSVDKNIREAITGKFIERFDMKIKK